MFEVDESCRPKLWDEITSWISKEIYYVFGLIKTCYLDEIPIKTKNSKNWLVNFRVIWVILEQIIPYRNTMVILTHGVDGYKNLGWKNWPQDQFMFMLKHIQKGASLPIVEAIVYSLKYFLISVNLEDSCETPVLKNLLNSRKKWKKEPITVEEIKTLWEKAIQHPKRKQILSNLRTFLVIIFGFSSFLRFSELASLRRTDMMFYQTYMELFL